MGSGPSRRTGVGLALAALAVAAVVASTTGVFDDDTPTTADTEIGLPDPDEPPAATDDADDGTAGSADDGTAEGSPTRLDCDPTGCEQWRSDAIAERPVLASDDLVVLLGREELVGLDVATGDERWRQPAPEDDDVAPPHAALSTHGLAVAWGEGRSPQPVGHASTVSLYAPDDGSHQLDVELDLDAVLETAWLGDRLVVVGRASGDAGDTLALVGVAADGDIVWRQQSPALPLLLVDETAILTTGEEVALLDASDGETRWQRPGRLESADQLGSELVVQDGTATHVVDVATGDTLQTIQVDGASQAARLGPWVAVTTPGEVQVHEASTGEELFRRDFETSAPPDGLDPPALFRRIAATTVDEQVVVAWTEPDASEVEVVTYTTDGEAEQTLTVEPPEFDVGIALHHGGEQPSIVQLVTYERGGSSVTSVDLATGEIDVHPDRQQLANVDGLLATRDETGLWISAPGGEIAVRHADRLATTDPLVVHGVGGILRLDRDLIIASD